MESIKSQLSEITQHFNNKMADFQKELKGTTPDTSSSSIIKSEFGTFRSFVLTALENLQLQVELLARQQDELETRSRKKILLVHGVTEEDREDPCASVPKILSEHLGLQQLSADSLSRCHRLGRADGGRPRAVLVKFRELSLRDKVWAAKTKLKGSGVTLSEFLIPSRHKIFLAARQRFGIARCWTRDGSIMVLDSVGKRHRITSMSELSAIPTPVKDVVGSTRVPTAAADAPKVSRIRKAVKK